MEADVATKAPLMPRNYDMEKAVLGCYLLDNSLLGHWDLKKEDFYSTVNRTIFEHMMKLFESSKKFDVHILWDYMDRAGCFPDVTPAYLLSLYEAVTTVANYEDYLEIVVECAIHREIIASLTDILQRAYAREPLESLTEALRVAVAQIRVESKEGPKAGAVEYIEGGSLL